MLVKFEEATTFTEWLEAGRQIAQAKHNIEWAMADWVSVGREQFPEQVELALGEMVGNHQRISKIEKTVKAFPPHMRDPSLSFDHHMHVADVPTQQALPLLQHAKSDKMSAQQFRLHVMLDKVAQGQILPAENDPEYDQIVACARAWNRADTTARIEFAEMVADSDLGIIEP